MLLPLLVMAQHLPRHLQPDRPMRELQQNPALKNLPVTMIRGGCFKDGYLPFHTGSRFSAKALKPSIMSSLP